MQTTMAMPVQRRAVLRVWPIVVALAIAVPLGSIAYFMTPALSGILLDDAVEHFTITTNIALIAAAISIAVMRSALDMKHWPSVLVGLGFMSLAGLFALHGLSTPGVLMRGSMYETAAGTIIALSAQLSLFVPAVLFALRYTPAAGWLQRSRTITPRRVLAALAVAIIAFDIFGLLAPLELSGMVDQMTGYSAAAGYGGYGGTALQANPLWVLAASGTTVVLLAFSAYKQSGEFVRTRLPTSAALAIAFLFLAEAQIAMVLGTVYSLVFWDYHGLMALATILAVGALFLELDRRRGLERFLPMNVVDSVIVGDRMSLMGQRHTATILFTDLRGSTALAERLSPERTVSTINAYLRAMARAVIDEGGILDKFTGDGLMAIFGAMSDPAAGAAAAARAALRMRSDIAALNAERAARGDPTVGYGIGLNTGDVVLGAVGLPERSDYTAMGDTVNTAARMESLTKELGAEIVVSLATAAHLTGTKLRPLGSASVKGKSAPIPVFTIE